MDNILVIGAAGQIGSELVVELRKIYGNAHVYATDIKQPPPGLLGDGPFQVLDVMDDKQLIHFIIRHRISQIYHLAAVLSGNAEKLPVQAWNIQDLVNGLDWMAATLKGKVALDVDIDRQHITPCGSPEEVRSHALDILRLLDDPAGGLILTYGLYPGTAWENAMAMAEVLDEVAQGRRG